MANNYKKRNGDRADGRRIRTLSGFSNFIPYIMSQRNDALNLYEASFEVDNADHWLREQRKNGYKGIGFLHLIIAAYIRCIAARPALNRFVVGRRIFARNSIEIVMAVKRNLSIDTDETMIKVEFEPTDTVFDVYRKMNKAIEDVKTSDDSDDVAAFADKFAKLPRFVIRFVVWIIKILDYFGWLPKKLLKISPFHGSMIITDLGSLGIGPVYHHIYNFGSLPVFIAFGAKRTAYELDQFGTVHKNKYVDAKFTIDERTFDGHYCASIFKLFNQYINDPSLLEVPPEVVVEDIF